MSILTLNTRKAFPTARGFGRNASGGRGGTIIKVTNLNNSGAGSLREALTASGARTVIFTVGGIITLTSYINITNGDLTIAGETAPGDGILITQNGLINQGLIAINAPNVIMRNMRFRPVEYVGTDPSPCCQDAANIFSTGNVIVDHCSFTWGSDETLSLANLSVGGVLQNVTLQNCVISQPQAKYGHAYGSLVAGGATNITYYRNLYANNQQRSPLIGGGSPDPPGPNHELVQNLVYNWWQFGMIIDGGGSTKNVNFINNVVNRGPSTISDRLNGIGIGGNVQAYAEGNYVQNRRDLPTDPEWDAIGGVSCSGGATYMNCDAPLSQQQGTPYNYPLKDEPILTKQQVIDTVLANVSTKVIDRVDQDIFNTVTNNTGFIMNVPSDVGGLPTINGGTYPSDSQVPGIANTFATTHGITSANQIITNWNFGSYQVVNNAGYNALEMYNASLMDDFNFLINENNTADTSYDVTTANIILSTLKAFPSAEGHGKNTTGGRGGQIIRVTNLNATGAGSFAEALNTNATRIIVFDVGGTIDRGGADLFVTYPNCTIAGETAPGGGICIKGGELNINVGNVIVRHIRFRMDTNGDAGADSLKIRSFGAQESNVIVDHCSMSFGNDENISITNFTDVTVQYCLSGDNKGSGNMLFQEPVDRVTMYRNLGVWNQYRNFRSSTSNVKYESINNMFYGISSGQLDSWENWVDVIGNIWENDTDAFTADMISISAGNTPGAVLANSRLYVSDNIQDGGAAGIDSEWNPYIQGSPQVSSGAPVESSSNVETILLNNVGAGRDIQGLDSYDQSLIDDVTTNVASGYNARQYPTLASGTPPTSTTIPGIPDSFVTTHNISSATQVITDWDFGTYTVTNTAGYTAIEIYLFTLTKELSGDNTNNPPTTNTPPVITLLGSQFTIRNVGQSFVDPGVTAFDAEDGDITSNVVVTGSVNTMLKGDYILQYNVTDSDGNAADEVIRVVSVRSPQIGVYLRGGKAGATTAPICYIGDKKLQG